MKRKKQRGEKREETHFFGTDDLDAILDVRERVFRAIHCFLLLLRRQIFRWLGAVVCVATFKKESIYKVRKSGQGKKGELSQVQGAEKKKKGGGGGEGRELPILKFCSCNVTRTEASSGDTYGVVPESWM